jgi:hypothetical protein
MVVAEAAAPLWDGVSWPDLLGIDLYRDNAPNWRIGWRMRCLTSGGTLRWAMTK